MEEGNRVEVVARKKFPSGILIKHGDDRGISFTQDCIRTSNNPTLFHSTFLSDIFLARNDILEFDSATNSCNLYEIKSSSYQEGEENATQVDHIEDATFQAVVLKEQGMSINKIFLITINKQYVLDGDIDVGSLFHVEDITEEIGKRERLTRENMQRAKIDLLERYEEDLVCECIYKGRNQHCDTFNYSCPDIPEDNVYDIARISAKKLKDLVSNGILDINDVPEQFDLTVRQKRQVNAHKRQKPAIDHKAIREVLSTLQYPLYFLDYETHAPAIPIFEGTSPYKHLSFQFSLHVIENRDSEPIHREYLHEVASDPSLWIIQELKNLIGTVGTIVMWRKSFEKQVNAELAERYPEYKNFLHDINDRSYDLMNVFQEQMHIHPSFKGRVKLKAVHPALIPTSRMYEDSRIKDGMHARRTWISMIYGNMSPEKKQEIAEDLKKYCSSDTYAMYEIWSHLDSITNDSY